MKKCIIKTLFAFSIFSVIGCSKKSSDQSSQHTFVGQRVLRAGSERSEGVGPPDCDDPQEMAENTILPGDCTTFMNIIGNYTGSVSYAVIATVDLDTAKYGKIGAEIGSCREGHGPYEEWGYVPYTFFRPEVWLKGDGSQVKKIGFLGSCTNRLGPEVACLNALSPGIVWYYSSGRNLLFLGEDCCLEEMMGEGTKYVAGAFPVEGDFVYDFKGRAWPLEDVIEKIKSVAAEPPSWSKEVNGKVYYYHDYPCGWLDTLPRTPDTTTSERDAVSSEGEIYYVEPASTD